jgi:hypothetical protein
MREPEHDDLLDALTEAAQQRLDPPIQRVEQPRDGGWVAIVELDQIALRLDVDDRRLAAHSPVLPKLRHTPGDLLLRLFIAEEEGVVTGWHPEPAARDPRATGDLGEQLRPEQLLVINCPGTVPARAIPRIRDFVARGGSVFTETLVLHWGQFVAGLELATTRGLRSLFESPCRATDPLSGASVSRAVA